MAIIEKAEASSRPHGEHAQPAAQVSQPHAEPEIEIAPVQHALFSELDRLDDKGLWQLLGYAKGMALVSDAMNDLEPRNAEDSLCRSIEIGSLHEAQGLADALRLARSAVRAQRLLDLRQLNTDQVIDIISNQHPDFPMAPLLKYDEDGHLVEVVYPPAPA